MHDSGKWVMIFVLGLCLTGCGEQDTQPERKPSYADLEAFPERLDADGTTIIVGDPKAPISVHLLEDPRCPFCEEFELTGGGSALRGMTEQREVKTEYTLASFLDDRVGGGGSKRAVNALRAALDVDKFAEFHAVLYKNQPEETVDGFTTAYLLELADQVEGLRGPAFDSAVKTMKYRDFVETSQEAYEHVGTEGGPGTPSAVINGKLLPEEYSGVLYERKLFDQLLKEVVEDPEVVNSFS